MNDQTNHHPQPAAAQGDDSGGRRRRARSGGHAATVVLDVSGLQWASQQRVVEVSLRRRPGVLEVQVNAVAQTATVTFNTSLTSLADLRRWVQDCGYHCSGQSVPSHLCDPMNELGPAAGHEGHPSADAAHEGDRSPHEVMGHGGLGGMSMDTMVRDMRTRFLVAAVFAVPILLWSPIGRDVFGVDVPVPFGWRVDVWSLLLSLPVIFYADSIFFDGAVRALRARTLDMMVLVAVAVGAGWLYSVVVTFTGGGDVFTRRPRCCRRSCCSGTGSRCAPAAGPTRPSAHC